MNPEILAEAARIIGSTPMGRQWAADAVAAHDYEARCLALRRRGLADSVVGDLYRAGDVNLLTQVEALSSEQLRRLHKPTT